MANKSIEMSKLRQILRLYSKGIGKQKIADRLGSSKNTVKAYIDQFSKLGTTIEEALLLSDLELNNLFNPPRIEYTSERVKALYEFFPEAVKELRRKGVTRLQVYHQYKIRHPDGFATTQFYKHFAKWSTRVKTTMHMEHVAGDKAFADYAGATLPYVDEDTGEILSAQVFVAILGWSQYAYVEAMRSQTTEDFISGCENAMQYFEGVPLAWVPDNLKSAVTKANKYEPTLNENFKGLMDHYGSTGMPARSRKPQDKAHVENLVKLVYQRIYAQLPVNTALPLKELNARVKELLEAHNNTPIKALNASRTERWMMEKNALNPLSPTRFELRTIRQVTVQKSCHVLLTEDKHYYSVPFQLIGKKVKLIYSRSTVEIYDNYRLVAAHQRIKSSGNYSAIREHLPADYQHVMACNPDHYINKAKAIDPIVEIYVRKVLEKKTYPQQAFKSCDGILAFNNKVGRDRLIKACKRGHEIGHYGYKVIESILIRGIDQFEFDETPDKMPAHNNIRGNYN